MPEVTRSPGGEVIQLSIFLDNKVGRLNELVSRLASGGIHLLAISLLDTTECTIMRVIVDHPEAARDFLLEHGYAFCETTVVVIEVLSEAEIREITCALVEAETNIHYLYAFISQPLGKTALALHVEDNELAAQVLSAKGKRVLSHHDLVR